MDTLQALREKNPGLPMFSVHEPEFRPFGRVFDFDAAALSATCKQAAVMPDTGSCYVPDMPVLEELPDFAAVRRTLRGEGECQIGCCWGYNTMLNCLEYHRASEHLIAASDLVVLLASQQALEGFTLPQGSISGFFVPEGTTIELYATTLHFSPCQTSDAGFLSIIVLPRGTNHPLQSPRPAEGDGRLLWARDKWLIAHPDNAAVIAKGAYPGIGGRNHEIKY